MKIVFLDAGTMGTSSLAPIESQGELVAWPNSTPEESVARVSDCDVLIVNKIKVNDRLLDAAPRLRLVCEAGTGINNIDVDACERRGVLVRNVAGYSTDSVVQETFMHILNLLGNGAYFDEVVKSGAYSRSGLFTDYSRPFIEMAGKTLGAGRYRSWSHRLEGRKDRHSLRNERRLLFHFRHEPQHGISFRAFGALDARVGCDLGTCSLQRAYRRSCGGEGTPYDEAEGNHREYGSWGHCRGGCTRQGD